jgi:hypothetical protein
MISSSTELSPNFWQLTQTTFLSLYDSSARTTQKTQPLNCWEGFFTHPFSSNGRPIVAAYASAGTSLPSRCLAVGLYVTIRVLCFKVFQHSFIITLTSNLSFKWIVLIFLAIVNSNFFFVHITKETVLVVQPYDFCGTLNDKRSIRKDLVGSVRGLSEVLFGHLPALCFVGR